MTLLKNFSIRAAILLFAALVFLSSDAAHNYTWAENIDAERPGGKEGLKIAVFPIYNLSGSTAPLTDIRWLLIQDLQDAEATFLEDDVLNSVMAKYRVRYIGGLDQTTAQAMRQEAGVDGVLITSLELFSEVTPPKVALTSRLVSTGNPAEILWIDGVGLAGDDAPGLLDYRLVTNPQILLRRALRQLAQSLMDFFSGRGKRLDPRPVQKKFSPGHIYRSDVQLEGRPLNVAVVPFFNLSTRSFGGEIMALHFIRQLWADENFHVVEPGLVRQRLLELRIVMNSGVSLADVSGIALRLNTDFVLNGKVIDYQDYQGYNGTAKVDFSAQLIGRASRETIWSVKSYHRGNDGVFFFDWGKVNTAYALASDMVQLAVKTIE
jgi:TolB-like protein